MVRYRYIDNPGERDFSLEAHVDRYQSVSRESFFRIQLGVMAIIYHTSRGKRTL